MMDVIAMFKESDARDELGLGAIRDGLADHFFPGTGTVQTRARYFFFVPWIYRSLERRKTPAHAIADKARRLEVQLIEKLLASGERQGVIGREARAALKRLPSNIYWQGMHRLGILRFDGTQQQYHRSVDQLYADQRAIGHRSAEDDEAPTALSSWHPQLPPEPEGFPEGAGLALAHPEGVFLRDQIELRAGQSLFAWFASRCGTAQHDIDHDDMWADDLLEAYPARLADEVVHARNFAVTMHGAALCYNALLAERGCTEQCSDRGGVAWEELREGYAERIEQWREECGAIEGALAAWRQDAFRALLARAGVHVTSATWYFVDAWIALAGSDPPPRLQEDARVRTLITERERALKNANARLVSRSALENWSGASGAGRISYRWGKAQTMLADIHAALGEAAA
jgi:hypothetical protein